MDKHPLRNTWANIKARCLRPANRDFKNYGGRGIRLCERWLSFENFVADVGDRPSLEHSIDRIDVNGDYEPSNVRWATAREQANNMRKNLRLEYNGAIYSLKELSEVTGVGVTTIQARLARNYPMEMVISADRLWHLRKHRSKKTGAICDRGHAYTPENTYIDPAGRRFCRECKKINLQTFYAKRNAA